MPYTDTSTWLLIVAILAFLAGLGIGTLRGEHHNHILLHEEWEAGFRCGRRTLELRCRPVDTSPSTARLIDWAEDRTLDLEWEPTRVGADDAG